MSNYQSSQQYDTPRENTPSPTHHHEASTAMPNGKPSANTQKSRKVFIILGVLLGWLGIHNFYAGYFLKGAFQLALALLTAGLVSLIWSWIEVFIIKEDANGVPFV